jgi:hypothetical protein
VCVCVCVCPRACLCVCVIGGGVTLWTVLGGGVGGVARERRHEAGNVHARNKEGYLSNILH